MAEPRRVLRKTSDDSGIHSSSYKKATSFEDELKQKAMTLGRKPKQRIMPPSEQTDGAPPPPPPARSLSRRGSRGSSQINDCTQAPPPNPPVRSRPVRKHSPHDPIVEQTSGVPIKNAVSSLASSFETGNRDETRPIKFKPPAPKPQPKLAQQSNSVAPGIASSKAKLEAMFGGGQVGRQVERENKPIPTSKPSSYAAPTEEYAEPFQPVSSHTEDDNQSSHWPKPSRLTHAPPAQEYDEPFKPVLSHTESANDERRSYRPKLQRQTPPPPVKRTTPRHSPSPGGVFQSRVSEKSQGQGYESSHSSGGSRVSLIKESSSVESLDAQVSLPENIEPPPPPLPARGYNDQSEIKPRKKVTRSHSMKSTLWTHKADASQKESRTPPPEEPPAQTRDRLNSSTDVHTGPNDLLTMVTKGANFLPMCVEVCRGFCSTVSESNVFSKFEQLYLHFIKNCKVCLLKDECTDEQYTVPMGSALEFGILYEGKGADVSQFINTVGDILKLKPLPAAVQATKSFDGGSPEKSVEAGELLFLKKMSKPLLGKGKVLEVSTIDGMVKRLSSTCEGDFSIHPYHIKMTLPVLIEQSIPMPQRVYLFPTATLQEYLPTTMTEEPTLLESIKGETSIICTMKEDSFAEQAMDVAKDLAIEVQMQPLTEVEEAALHDTTSQLYSTLNPAHLKYIAEKETSHCYKLQCALNQDLVPGKEMEGVHFQLPSSFSLVAPPVPIESTPHEEAPEITSIAGSDIHEPAEDIDDIQNDYEDVGSALAQLPPEEANKLTKSLSVKAKSVNLFKKLKSVTKPKKQLDRDYEDTDFGPPPQVGAQAGTEPTEDYKSFELEKDQYVRNYPPSVKSKESGSSIETESNYAQLNSKIASLTSELNALKLHVHKLTTLVEGLSGKGVQSHSSSDSLIDLSRSLSPPGAMAATPTQDKGQSEEINRNKGLLRTLSHNQVLQLLDKMGLSNFKGPFQKNPINGEQLSKLNEHELEDSFEMKSNFHRKKLLRVVSGALSVEVFLPRTS